MQAIGSMMATMMFKDKQVQPFYAEAERYAGFEGAQLSTGVKNMAAIPTFDLQIPKPKPIAALKIINERGGKIQKKELVRLAEDHELITVKEDSQNHGTSRDISHNANIIQPV